MLTRVSIGWKWLTEHLNAIIDEVNLNRPIGSATITADQSPGGTVLRVVGQNDQQAPAAQGGGQGGGVYQINLQGVAWQSVTVVDPTSCAQSSITVLVQQAGSEVTFIATLTPIK